MVVIVAVMKWVAILGLYYAWFICIKYYCCGGGVGSGARVGSALDGAVGAARSHPAGTKLNFYALVLSQTKVYFYFFFNNPENSAR